jgi:Fur family ferric uptake transcriptional regulator
MAKKKSHHLTIEMLLTELKRNKLKLTPPRKLVLETLLANHGPFSVEELQTNFIKNTCDLATVYRTVTSLEEINLVRRCEFGDGIARYELVDPNHHHHHHLICKQCKSVEVIEACELEKSINQLAKKRGFSNISHILEFFGVCPNCQD